MNPRKAYRRAVCTLAVMHGARLWHRPSGWRCYNLNDTEAHEQVLAASLAEYNQWPVTPTDHPSMKAYGSRWQAAEAYCARHQLNDAVFTEMTRLISDGKDR